MESLDYRSISFELKAADSAGSSATGPMEISGVGSVFNNIDSTGDIIAPESFNDTIDLFIKSGFVGGINHDWDNPIGHPVEAREVPEGLYFRAVLDDTDDARRLRAKMLPNPASGRATIRKLSIGFKTLQSERLSAPEGVLEYWTKAGYTPNRDDIKALAGRDSVRLLTKLHLYEISPVVVPANDRAVITGVKSGTESRPDFVSHSREVVSTDQEFLRRVKSRLEARGKAGRVPSRANLDAVTSVADVWESGAGELRDMLSHAQPGKAAAHDVNAEDGVNVKGVVPYRKGTILEAETWDGDAAEARVRKWASKDGSGDKDAMDWGKYRSAFSYVDPDGEDGFGAYHLLHHDVADGELRVARKGVFAAAVIVQGGRGGGAAFVGRIGPDAADGIRAHLGKHYDDMDLTAPWGRKAWGPDHIGWGFNREEIEAAGLDLAAYDSWPTPLPLEPETQETMKSLRDAARSESRAVPSDEVARLFAQYMDTFEAPRWAASPIGS